MKNAFKFSLLLIAFLNFSCGVDDQQSEEAYSTHQVDKVTSSETQSCEGSFSPILLCITCQGAVPDEDGWDAHGSAGWRILPGTPRAAAARKCCEIPVTGCVFPVYDPSACDDDMADAEKECKDAGGKI